MSSPTYVNEPAGADALQLLDGDQHWSPHLRASERKQLGGDPPQLQLPTDYPRKAVQTFRDATHSVVITGTLSKEVNALSRHEGVPVSAILLAAFKAFLYRYTGQEEIASGCIVARECPESPETQKPISSLIDIVVLSTDLSDNPSFRELARRVEKADVSSSNVAFEPSSKSLSTKHLGHNITPQVLFSLQSELPETDSSCTSVATDAKYDLYLHVESGLEGITGKFNYNADLFDASTIIRMAGHWERLLQGAITDAGRQLSELPLLSDTERHQLLLEWNDTKADYPVACLHELIEAQVRRTPEDVAVIFKDQTLTYRELNARANQLGHYLQKLGVGPDVLVGICVERSLEMVAGLLGILKAGGTYVPLDPQYPDDRLSLMVEDSHLKVLVTQNALKPKFSDLRAQFVCLDSDQKQIAKESLENCRSDIRDEHLAYVIYTSGSTGKPKGVMITHRAICNHMEWMRKKFPLRESDRVLQKTPFSFDASVWEFYAPLMAGAQLVMAQPGGHRDSRYLVDVIMKEKITVLQVVPSLLQMLLQEPELQKCHSLRRIFCGGEALSRELVDSLFERLSVEVYNLYGPTEVTIDSLSWQCRPGELGVVPIGRPVDNIQAYVLDRDGQPVPPGVSGQLYLGGKGLARGYVNRPDLTAHKFVPNPFGEPGTRLYQTGDVARWLPHGVLDYLGRTDHQVKIRGFRIELGEIETALSQHPGVSHNVIMAREDFPGDKRLVAYVVPKNGPAPKIAELYNFLKQHLPEYMLPSRFVFLEAFPLAPNGKVDRRALPVPEQVQNTHHMDYVAPRDVVESQLASLWESVLNIHPVGIGGNFFDLGGHSLLVPKLLGCIEQVFERKLSMAAIFQAPTIEQMAAIIRNEVSPPRLAEIVPVQPLGTRPPFFLVGPRPLFRSLAQELGFDQPFLGLHFELSELDLRIPYKLEDIASYYVRALRQQQPEGPYYLGGYCFDGVLAYEMATQLMAEGQPVDLLVLFEADNPAYESKLSKKALAERLKYHFWNLRRLKSTNVPLYLAERVGILLRRLKSIAWSVSYDLRFNVGDGRLRNSRKILNVAAAAYRPQRYGGRVVLFKSKHQSLESCQDFASGWGDLVKDMLDIQEIPGDHISIFYYPNVEILARKMIASLDAAQLNTRNDSLPVLSRS